MYTLIYVTIVFFIICYTIIKWKYGFWMRQPVYHIYNIPYYFTSDQIIDKSLPEKNKYVQLINIHTKFMGTLHEYEWHSFVVFLQKYFLREKHNKYNPRLENIVPYFKNSKSLCSFYYETIQYKNETDGSIVVNDQNIIGVMTSRPVFSIINNKSLPIYYVDYLCVSPKHRNTGIASSLIQTHHYNQRRLNSPIHVSLFKRDHDMTWIVPLTYYNTYLYSMDGYNVDVRLHARYKILVATPSNISKINVFISTNRSKFDVCIYEGEETIVEQINTNNMLIYAIVNADINDIISVYLFKNPKVTISEKNVVTCIGSVCGDISDDVFYFGFVKILQQIPIENKIIAIEDISDNINIISNEANPPSIYSTPTAYFLYNYICSPVNTRKCLIIL